MIWLISEMVRLLLAWRVTQGPMHGAPRLCVLSGALKHIKLESQWWERAEKAGWPEARFPHMMEHTDTCQAFWFVGPSAQGAFNFLQLAPDDERLDSK